VTLIASMSRASLAALQWAADRAGKSYGVFTQTMTAEDEKHIQEEYEAYKRERDANPGYAAFDDDGNQVYPKN